MNNSNLFKRKGEDFFLGKYTDITRPWLVEVGSHTAIDSFFFCSTGLLLGDYIHIASHVSIIGGKDTHLEMDHFSFIAAGSRLICASEDYTAGGLMGATIPAKYKAVIKYAPIVFERFSGVGTGCIIMPGVKLAIGSLVGAGSVVTKSTEPWGIYLGSPAKLIKFKSDENIEQTLQNAKEMGYDQSI